MSLVDRYARWVNDYPNTTYRKLLIASTTCGVALFITVWIVLFSWFCSWTNLAGIVAIFLQCVVTVFLAVFVFVADE